MILVTCMFAVCFLLETIAKGVFWCWHTISTREERRERMLRERFPLLYQ